MASLQLTNKYKITLVTVVYWVLLTYMIAALVWWFIALQNQNNLMANMRLLDIKKDDVAYFEKVLLIEDARQRKITQYIGEGGTFLVLILIGAVFVFRATRKQLKLSMQQQNFMMAITHELKTPIAVTQLNLETLQKHKLEETKQQKLISNTLQETNRLNILCNNILLVSQLEAGGYTNTKQEISLSVLVKNCIQDFNNRYPFKKTIIDIEQDIFILGEELLLQMLVNNLMENAHKYAAKETAVTITLNKILTKVELKIIDEGIGISNEEKSKVFNKFYRIGNENVRTTKGTGLGLYLCKRIVKSHNATLLLTDNTPQGSIFTATFSAYEC